MMAYIEGLALLLCAVGLIVYAYYQSQIND
jgi:hypothetical protein